MWERQAVKLSGVSAETEQRRTVETITVAKQSDRGMAHTDEDEGRTGITPPCTDAKYTNRDAHARLINAREEKHPDTRPRILIRPCGCRVMT